MKAIQRYFLAAVFLLSFHHVLAQTYIAYDSTEILEPRRAKAIYVEALGSSGFGMSINYDMRFKPGHKGWGFRAGIAQPYQVADATTYYFPLKVNKVHSDKRVALEHGFGPVIVYKRWEYEDLNFNIHQRQGFHFLAVANVGVRFQPLKTGVVWRLYWNPNYQIGSGSRRPMLFWFSTSLGIGFN
ncbi:hypothetical protein [Persicitalea jodogahamensis]|uniref:Outer membrane protein beta-barrel domain-containing protein n=1 Tax=Persicitalea jodogahamensis TaxID=402147 RepID=A0A8J3D4C4_9BACT|nr:hypothetical protein [Persicitalea jodogahamensis]GHB71262.1 hypothetical protein GCM10007390_26310 [Persicitalea jodogahamensis]